MSRHSLTAEDLWRVPRVGQPEPLPDGSGAVVPVTTYSMEGAEGVTRLWLAAAKGPTRPLTAAETSAKGPAVSPDGGQLAFLREPGGEVKGSGPQHLDKTQLYVMPMAGGEAERLTDMPLGVLDALWFPDGRRIALLAEVYADALDLDAAAEKVAALEKEPLGAHVTEDRVYRFWDRWLTDGRVHHLFVLDTVTGDIIDITPDSTRWFGLMEATDAFRIAPDGREIAFGATKSAPPHDPLVFGVFTVPVPEAGAAPGEVVDLASGHGAHAYRPVYSPDGDWIVYGIQRDIDFYADKVRLVAQGRGGGAPGVLTEDWPLSAEGWAFAGPDTVVLAAEVEGRRGLFALDLPAALEGGAEPRELARGGWLGNPHVAGDRIFVQRHSLRQVPEVAAGTLGAGDLDLATMTDFGAAAMAEVDLGEVEDVRFEGADGDEVQMFVVHPPAAAAGPGARPLVHMIHGGPHGVFGDFWHFRWNAQAFAAAGYVVALVNFHGSTGWGQDFTASILGRWGDQPYRDVMAATDVLVEQGCADPQRMAVTGGSFGGYLVSWICARTDRFRCAVNHAGVCDFQTQYASDITQGRRRSMGGEVWDDLAGLDAYNPMRHAAGFSTPMLVIHGMKDYRVPYAQGVALYNVLVAKGVAARLVVYPDENHWVLKPQNSRHWYGEVLGWLDRWLADAGQGAAEGSAS